MLFCPHLWMGKEKLRQSAVVWPFKASYCLAGRA